MHLPQRLPLELCELVIDNLDDENTLQACSLTCKALLHASRHHLFYHIHLDDPRISQRFLHIICSKLSSTSPCQYIRYLTLDGDEDAAAYGRGVWVNDALPILATCLLHVTTLELVFHRSNILKDTARISVLSGFQKVKCLTISHNVFDSAEQMIQLIASFPSLTHLSLPWTACKNDGPTCTPLPLGLQAIALDSRLSFIFHQFLSFELHPIVRSIKILPVRPGYTQGVGTLLKTIGSSLEELDLYSTLGSQRRNAETVLTNDIDLVHNTHLCSISMGIFRNFTYSMNWLFTLLSQVVSPHVVRVSLQFGLSDVSVLDYVDWAQIELMFTQQPWNSLQKLKMDSYCPNEISSEVVASIRARLPGLESRGILCIDCSE